MIDEESPLTTTWTSFHPGATFPIIAAWREPEGVVVGDWTATFMLRKKDSQTEPDLELEGVLTEINYDDAPEEVKAKFPTSTEKLWRVIVTPTPADTQELRGWYWAGLDLETTGANVPLLDQHRIWLGIDAARPAVET